MEIGQREESGKYKFYVNIDGKQALLLDNNSPQEFKNGQMYVGDPWYDAAGVQLRNIRYNDESFVTPPVQLSPIRNALKSWLCNITHVTCADLKRLRAIAS